MGKDFIKIGIAFIPPKEVSDLAVKLSMGIGQGVEAFYILDEKNFYSHVTIYSTEFPVSNLEKLVEWTGELSKKMLPTRFEFAEVSTKAGWIGIEAECSQEIQKIHEEFLVRIGPLREGHLREKDQARLGTLSGVEKNNLQLYGHTHMMELYHPHLTLIRLKDEKAAEKIASEIEWPIREFMLGKIGVFKMAEHGTCVELIKEFNLN